MRIGFLGAGKMAEAILSALIRNRIVPASNMLIRDVVAQRRTHLRRKYKVRVAATTTELVHACDVIILAVKPQDLDELLVHIAPALGRHHVVISIAAGKNLAHLQKLAGRQVRLIRVMPNLAVMVGEGMSAYCLGRQARPADRKLAARLLGCCGRVVELHERHFDAVTALSGSGPAFFTYLMAALADAATAEGLPADAARLLAEQTMLGAARYLLETGIAPAELIQAVASPKGTTAAGLAVLESSSVRQILVHTIQAAAHRSRELSQAK
ncbi:MAG: pyrroline-5-carboxylate reductase [Kiritimatiellia bacterium]